MLITTDDLIDVVLLPVEMPENIAADILSDYPLEITADADDEAAGLSEELPAPAAKRRAAAYRTDSDARCAPTTFRPVTPTVGLRHGADITAQLGYGYRDWPCSFPRNY